MKRIARRASIVNCNQSLKSLQMIYTVKRETIIDYEGIMHTCYGIEIITYPDGRRTLINSVTTNHDRAIELAGILSQYAVTPTTAFDVVYDLLCADAEI